MALHYRTCGFVIKKNDIAEADRIFTVFSQDFGKIKILGKAIRKITSKLKSGIDTFYLSEIEFIQGKTYKTLTDSVVLEKFENIKKNYICFWYSFCYFKNKYIKSILKVERLSQSCLRRFE